MRSSLSRRQPQKIGQDDEEDGSASRHNGVQNQDQELTPTVIRPSITSRGLSKTKKRSSLCMSFGPAGTSMTEDDGDDRSTVFTPKKSNLGRQATEKNALRKSLAANISLEHSPLRQTRDRPSYNTDYLNELKTSTPTTPKDLHSNSDTRSQETKALDLATKFGSDLIVQDAEPAIPTDAEIREKKERRARLAKEQEFISLNDDEDDGAEDGDQSSDDERSLQPYAQRKTNKKEETRLVRDDEDIAEGFDEFVSDGRIALGKKAEREQKRRQEAEIRNMINEAEGVGSDESGEDDSETERKAAYEAAQTKKGMDGLYRAEEGVKSRRPRTPPKITPLPTISGCLERLKGQLVAKQNSLNIRERRLEETRKEREDIKSRQEEVQRLLKETGENYEKLRLDAAAGTQSQNGMSAGAMIGIEQTTHRGLETFGNG